MFLKNSFSLFMVLHLLFSLGGIPKPNWSISNDPEKSQMVYKVSLDIIKNLKPCDSFSIERPDAIYYYKVMQKFDKNKQETFSNPTSWIIFTADVDQNRQVVVMAILTGKLVKN